jgi:DNA-binding GntR family transcriptional regulator
MSASPSFAAVHHQDLVNQIANQLTQGLLNGDYQPGSHLSEARLAQELGVSRAPVREAARLLESRGLLVCLPRRGFFVRAFSAKELDDVYGLRLCLEREAIGALATRATPEDLAALEALERQYMVMTDAASQKNAQQQIEADIHFHRLLCALSGNQRLLRVFDELTDEIRFCMLLLDGLLQDPAQLAQSHRPLLDALRTGEVDACLTALDQHLGYARTQVVGLFRERERNADARRP